MPQMMPMNWMMMFLMLMCIMLMSMTIMYSVSKQLPQNKNTKLNKHYQWMW